MIRIELLKTNVRSSAEIVEVFAEIIKKTNTYIKKLTQLRAIGLRTTLKTKKNSEKVRF